VTLPVDEIAAHRLKRAAAEDRLVIELEKIAPADALIVAVGAAIRLARRAGVTRDSFVRHAGALWDAVDPDGKER
jgi:hypothetical protein